MEAEQPKITTVGGWIFGVVLTIVLIQRRFNVHSTDKRMALKN